MGDSTVKPVINIYTVELEGDDGDGKFQQHWGDLSGRIGAQKLGYNLTVVRPGMRACPYHNHRANEEMFFVLEGSGLLRFGNKEYPLEPYDIIACPPGGRDVAHQIINTGNVDLKYLAVSTKEPIEIAEFPDSRKIMSYAGTGWKKDLRHVTRDDQAVDYMDGEK